MKKAIIIMVSVLFAASCCEKPATRWSEEKANEWYSQQEWPVGCNYVASNAVNLFEMWQDGDFNPELIDKELGLAESLGFNTIRFYLHDMLWEDNPQKYKAKVSQMLDILQSHGMKAIVTFFTNGGRFENPHLGPQPEPIQGVHCGQWIQSPGAPNVNDPTKYGRLEKYVKDILTTYKNDKRILYWCLYNEPENFKGGAQSMPLLREVFKWAREVNPSQPLSSPIWLRPGFYGERSALDVISFLGENCDIMTFHCYYGPEEMTTFIKMMKRFNRPIICQEYMGRPKSTFEEILPILKENKVGAINWGLVKGKCNFHLQWSSKAGDPEPEVWFHDIFWEDGTPYSQQEVDFIRKITGKTE